MSAASILLLLDAAPASAVPGTTPGSDGAMLVFADPLEIVRCDDAQAVPDALARIEAAGREGLHAAGFLSYELGYAFEPRLRPLIPEGRDTPLIWMGLFREPRRLEGGAIADFLRNECRGGHRLSGLHLSLDAETYCARIETILELIRAGEVYQINFTFPARFAFEGDPLSLYRNLRARQPVAHGGCLLTDEFSVLSLSPELFLESQDGLLTSRPMKGTAPLGATAPETERLGRALRADAKSQAENLMITDLIRNDLSRMAEIGSVKVPELFTLERYRSFQALTSTVTARANAGTTFGDILRAAFPCGSVTGAPKIRAQQAIRDLEAGPRGVYTGSIGHIAPNGDFRFNVAIRTLYIPNHGAPGPAEGRFHIGSGIVADSGPLAEFEECKLKARFLMEEAATSAHTKILS